MRIPEILDIRYITTPLIAILAYLYGNVSIWAIALVIVASFPIIVKTKG